MSTHSTFLKRSCALLMAGLCIGAASAAPPSDLPFELRVPVAPTPVKVDGAVRLLYELHINNLSGLAIEFTGLDVVNNQPGNAAVASYRGVALSQQLLNPGAAEGKGATLGAGAHVVAFVDVKLEAGTAIPKGLHHKLSFSLRKPDGSSVEKNMEGAGFAIDAASPLVLQAPLRGSGWLAYDLMDSSEAGGHRRTLMAVGGKAPIAQRYAIDWVRLDADGRMHKGKPGDNASWSGYGAQVLAVADGVVAELKDGIPDNPGNGAPLVPINLDTIGGNVITLNIGKGRYAVYGHMQPGSLRVKVGDKVRAGQVLGLLGNSGQSDGPHLHFHITDANSVLGAEGVPYVFASFKHHGIVADAIKLVETGDAWRAAENTKPLVRSKEMPRNFAVVEFP